MGSENVAVVQALLAALSRGDPEAAATCTDPAIEIDWTESEGPASGTFAGRQGFKRLFGDYNDAFEMIEIEPDELIEVEPHVLVPNTTHFHGRDGLEVMARSTLAFTIRSGLIVSIRLFQDRDDALRAAQGGS